MDVTKGQIAKLHTLKSQLRLSDEEYGAALESYGVTSSKNLSYEQAADLIKKLIAMLPKELRKAQEENFMQRRILGQAQGKKKYDELGIRYNHQLQEHYATPKQLRMIEAMWMTSPRVENKNEQAFLKFVKRITGKEKLEWLMLSDIRKIVKGIKSL